MINGVESWGIEMKKFQDKPPSYDIIRPKPMMLKNGHICMHAHFVPSIDPRYEMCDTCGAAIIAPAYYWKFKENRRKEAQRFNKSHKAYQLCLVCGLPSALQGKNIYENTCDCLGVKETKRKKKEQQQERKDKNNGRSTLL
jgi:hypothetical protein